MTTGGLILLGPFAIALLFGRLTVFLYLLGFVWAVPGAFLYARTAGREGLNAKSYAIRGALYSILNIGIWLYFAMKIHGRSMPHSIVRAFYIVLFANWLISSVFANIIWAWIIYQRSFEGTIVVIAASTFLIIGVASGVLWAVSLAKLLGRHRYNILPSDHPFIHRVFIMPVAFSFTSFMLLEAFRLIFSSHLQSP